MGNYPTSKSEIVNGQTETDGNQINDIEDFVGIVNDPDTSTLVYKLTNPASVGPGHKHQVVDLSGGNDGTMPYKDPSDHVWKAWLPDTIGLLTKLGEQTIAAKKTFTVLPETAVDPTSANQFTRKGWIEELIADFVRPAFAEMYLYNSAVALSIAIMTAFHPLRSFTEGQNTGFTFHAGATGAITIFATGGTGKTLVTCTAHGLATGDVIVIVGTTSYNGVHIITKTGDNTFTIDVTFVANDASGNWFKGSCLHIHSAGTYKVDLTMKGEAEADIKVFGVTIFQNATPVNSLFTKASFYPTNNIAISGFLNLADGDMVWIGIANETDDTDVTISNANLNITKVKNGA